MMAAAYSLQHDQEYQMYRALDQQMKAEKKARKQRQRELRAQLGHHDIDDQSRILGKVGNVVAKFRGRKRSNDSSRQGSCQTRGASSLSSESVPLFQGAGKTASRNRDLKEDGKEMDMKAALMETDVVEC